jgi:hypothetical protein
MQNKNSQHIQIGIHVTIYMCEQINYTCVVGQPHPIEAQLI